MRAVADFTEQIPVEWEMGDEGMPTQSVPRFTYVGDTIPDGATQ